MLSYKISIISSNISMVNNITFLDCHNNTEAKLINTHSVRVASCVTALDNIEEAIS